MVSPNATVEPVQRGREIVQNGELKNIREKVGISATVQAHYIGVQPVQLHAWEKGRSSPSPRSAIKVTNWYIDVHVELSNTVHDFDQLVHVSRASQYLGMSYATVLDWCSRQMLRCSDLGPLGVFVPRDEVVNHSKSGLGGGER
jgi:DNA-binding XRE family transcriptional regulator